MRVAKINSTKINPDGPTHESIIACHYPTPSIEPKDSPIAVTVPAKPKPDLAAIKATALRRNNPARCAAESAPNADTARCTAQIHSW